MTRPEPEWLLVVTHGRTGSTLVQGMLNATPGYLIRGENGGFVQAAVQSLALLTSARETFGASAREGATTASWYGADLLRPKAYRDMLYAAIVDQLDDPAVTSRVLGFKEIRWHYMPAAQREDFYSAIDALLPGVRFILHDRDPDAVRRSGWWAAMPDARVAEQFRASAEFRSGLSARFGDRCFETRYEDLVSRDAASLRALADWLGEPPDVLDAWRSVLDVSHGWPSRSYEA